MDERRFNVVFKGEIHEQATLSLVQERLAAIFKVDVEKIKIMFTKKRTIVKKNALWEECQKVEQGFLNSGAYVDMEEVFPAGYEPVPIEPGPPPGYEPSQDSENAAVQGDEYAPETEYVSPPDPEVVNPEPEVIDVAEPESYSKEPVMPKSLSQQPLTMADEPEIVPEPEEYEEEPSLGYAPMPLEELMPEEELISEDEQTSDDESDFEEDDEPEIELESDPEPEFEIVEDEDDSDLETTTEIEIIGLEPVIEHDSEDDSYIDPEYEFDDVEEEFEDVEEVVEEDLNSFEIENLHLSPKADPENPYASPRTNLSLDDDLKNKSNFVAPQRLPLKNGLNWLISGFKLFKQNSFTWSFSVFLYFLVSAVAGLIPVLGAIASNLFNPVFLAGFMLGAKEQTEGGKYRIGHAFAGFSNNTGQLILFGLLYLIASLAIFGLMAIIGIVAFFAMKFGAMNFFDPAIFSSLANISPLVIILFILVVMLITLPIMMAYYFSPALISINQVSVFPAAKMSFRACLINILPFLLYSLAWLGVFIVIALIIGGIAFIVGMLFEKAGIFVGIIGMFIVMFATVPVFLSSTYVAYKDIFYIK
jgi:hypothetical protein